MKYRQYILFIVMVLITILFGNAYLKRVNLNYSTEGSFLDIENGVVYHEQTTEVYGILAILGFIFSVFLIIRVLKKMC